MVISQIGKMRKLVHLLKIPNSILKNSMMLELASFFKIVLLTLLGRALMALEGTNIKLFSYAKYLCSDLLKALNLLFQL